MRATPPLGRRGFKTPSGQTYGLPVANPAKVQGSQFPVALQYTVSPSMEGAVSITTVVEHLLHRVLQFPVEPSQLPNGWQEYVTI